MSLAGEQAIDSKRGWLPLAIASVAVVLLSLLIVLSRSHSTGTGLCLASWQGPEGFHDWANVQEATQRDAREWELRDLPPPPIGGATYRQWRRDVSHLFQAVCQSAALKSTGSMQLAIVPAAPDHVSFLLGRLAAPLLVGVNVHVWGRLDTNKDNRSSWNNLLDLRPGAVSDQMVRMKTPRGTLVHVIAPRRLPGQRAHGQSESDRVGAYLSQQPGDSLPLIVGDKNEDLIHAASLIRSSAVDAMEDGCVVTVRLTCGEAFSFALGVVTLGYPVRLESFDKKRGTWVEQALR